MSTGRRSIRIMKKIKSSLTPLIALIEDQSPARDLFKKELERIDMRAIGEI